MAQLMPLPLTVSCFSKIHIGFTFLVPAHSGSPGQRAVKQVCVLSPCDAILALIKVYAVVACPSVHSCITSRYCVETSGRIELVFGMEASCYLSHTAVL